MTNTTEVEDQILKTDTLGRVKTPVVRWEQVLDEFERSGLSGKKFAALIEIKYQTFATNSSAWAQTYGYDAANRLTSIVSPAGSFGYTYQASLGGVTTASGLIKQIALPNGANITNDFDTSARLIGTYLRNSTNALLNSHEYVYNVGNQRTKQTRVEGDYVDYAYDQIGQLKTALGKESGGTTNRLQEQLGYAYDAAGNLDVRTNNSLIQSFNVNSLNELTTATRSGTLTVAGTTTMPATNVTVNTSNAFLYLLHEGS